MLRGDELAKQKWANLKVEFKSMAEEALLYLPYANLEDLDKSRKQIHTFDIKGAEDDIDFYTEHSSPKSEERLAKARAKIQAANDALAKLDEYEATLRQKIADAKVPAYGARVRVCADVMGLVGSPAVAYPEIGIIGIVEEGDEYDREHLGFGRVRVAFPADLLGYEIDEDDDDHNTIVLNLYTFEIEEVGPEVETARPYDEVEEPEANPAPEGKRYALLMSDGTEIGGHCCYTYAAMKDYAELLGVTLATVDIDPNDTLTQVIRA